MGLFTNRFLMLPSHPRHHPLSGPWPRDLWRSVDIVVLLSRGALADIHRVPWPLLTVLGTTDYGHLAPPSYMMASELPSFILFVAFCKPLPARMAKQVC